MGGAIGLAVLATLASQRTDSLRAAGEAHAVALNSGFHLAYLVGAGLVGAALVVAITVLESKPAAASQPEAEPEAGAKPEREPAYSEAG